MIDRLLAYLERRRQRKQFLKRIAKFDGMTFTEIRRSVLERMNANAK